MPGISGFSLYLPPYRVALSDWARWHDQPPAKLEAVIGRGFRMRGPEHNVYTLAANAVWKLLQAYPIDPAAVGYLALGTESSTDNAVGSVIVKGMLDDALNAQGRAPLARDCEVPEYKHACLGGVYALKGALRYLQSDGAGRQAIVVSADIAEYARGSTGEPTQGAGAVAMLVESEPSLLDVDLQAVGSASAYRGLDFRKPFSRFVAQAPRGDGQVQDPPVFNGRYSTQCYVDAARHALDAMLAKRGGSASDFFHGIDAVFMHRPYRRMPETAWVMAYLIAAAAEGGQAWQTLAGHCADMQIAPDQLRDELRTEPRLREHAGDGLADYEPYPLAGILLRGLRDTPLWSELVADKQWLGADSMMEMGNLYTAALPAWLACGLDQASREGRAIVGQQWLALGYGSGDAAEALPLRVVDGWREAAAAIDVSSALAGARDLSATQYAALHAGDAAAPGVGKAAGFVIDRVGKTQSPDFSDCGIEYYRYAG